MIETKINSVTNEIKTKFANILLIGPYEKCEFKPGRFLSPPLGLYRIHSFLKSQYIESEVYDPNLEGVERLKKLVRSTHFDFIGFSTYQPTLKNDIELLVTLFKISPKSVYIMGGEGAPFNHREILSKTPVIAVVKGFGELPLYHILKTYDKSKTMVEQFWSTPGLYIKDNQGKIIETQNIKPYSQDYFKGIYKTFDSSLVPYEKYWDYMSNIYSKEDINTVRLITSSHCSVGCTFCSSTNFLNNASGEKQPVLMLSAEEINRLLIDIKLKHPDTKTIFFNDDNFLVNKSRIHDLCKLVKTSGLRFIALGRADCVDKSLLEKMKEAGFVKISFGIESFSDKVLSDMHKCSTSATATRGIELTLTSGIIPLLNLIMFYPTVKKEDIIETVDKTVGFIEKGAQATYWSYVEAFRGSKIAEMDYDVMFEKFAVGKAIFENPCVIYPIDKDMRELSIRAEELKVNTVWQVKNQYNWNKILPQSVNTLIYFGSIYRLLGLPTSRITTLVDRLMKEGAICG